MSSHQFVNFHQLLLLLVELFVFDIQHHFEAVQLLLQIQGVGVLLESQDVQYYDVTLIQQAE